ncbi:MAG: type II secretion system F family protein, partial [Tepidimonas sp.]|uniref:type II secretion system F family protein n=1 Tax=Tepidimonas sp. TaxID=2002775 RepID=UPI00259F3A7E
MPIYRYRGVDAAGRVVEGELEALNLMELRSQLAQGQIVLLHSRQRRQRSSSRQQKLTPQEKLDLMYHLQMLLQAGVSIVDALEDLRSSDSLNLRRVGGVLLSRINAGESLAQAMRADPANFDPVVVSLVHAGEGTGA